jgi:ectoine hydroxylase-related dioxygenase (phytanoyl-CoA dioxygenase family)
MTPADVLTLRRQEREAEYEHRLMELDLACTGIAPVGADPRAPAHGVKAFVDDMRGLDFEQTARIVTTIHQEGYAIVPAFLDEQEQSNLRKGLAPFFTNTAKLFARPGEPEQLTDKQTIHIQNVLAKTDIVDNIAVKQSLRGVLAGVLGHDFVFNAGAVAMAPDPGCHAQGLHRDDGFFALIQRPHLPLVLTVAIALDDFYPDNGSTQLIPRSHLWPAERSPEPDDVVQVEMSAGSMLLWDGSLYHGGGANLTPDTRRTLTFNYTRGWLRTQFNQYLSIPRERILSMPTQLQADLGYHRSALGLGGCDQSDPLKYLERLTAAGGDGQQGALGREAHL